MAVYGYARVSTNQQANEGESLDVQRRQIEGYALMQGLPLSRVHVERGVSGSKPLTERPEGAALLQGLAPGDVVITPKLDRMFRSASDALAILDRLKAQGVAIHMIDLGGDVTANGVSKLVFTILAAVAESERDRIRERIAVVKADQQQRGRFLGGTPPFGYRVGADGDLEEIPEEQRAIRQMRTLREAGQSLRKVAEAVSADLGRRVSHVAVRQVLARAVAAECCST